MPIKRYIADKDCSITNAYKSDLINSGVLSNDGASDTLQVFALWNQNGLFTASNYNKQSRILIHFPIDQITTDINAGLIPASAEYYLHLFNAKHPETLPRDFTLIATPLSRSFNEGTGQDQYNFEDEDAANWISSSYNTLWTTPGGDLLSSTYTSSINFKYGTEDFYTDVSQMVRLMYSGTLSDNGFAIVLTSSQQFTTQSYYNKKFFGRTSEFYHQRPYIEARWSDFIGDDRINSFTSASIATSEDNLNTLYFYNYIRGVLKNIPAIGTGSVYVSIYTNSLGSGTALTFTGGYVSTGTYTCSFYTTLTGTVYDFWFSGSQTYFSSSVLLRNFVTDVYDIDEEFIINIKNLKSEYSTIEKPRLKLSISRKNWRPNYYLVYQNIPENEVLEKLYYKVDRIYDGFNVIPFGSGSVEFTKLSFNGDGNYFDLDMSLFEPDNMYQIKFLNIIENQKKEFPYSFKFRVTNQEDLDPWR